MTEKKKEKMSEEDRLHKIPLRITDTTLRDAHQSLWATRMKTEDMLGIIDVIDKVGYYSLECWGGATFDVCLRFLRENPWERLRLLKAKAKNTPLQMLLRGQNLVGYRNYADDVVDRFIALAVKNGMDIFRVFDALNDSRNLEAAIKAIKKYGAHAQGTLCYTISPVHTVEKYVEYAREQIQLGVDSLCIKDMAGILSPFMAEKLVKALIKEFDIPIQLHCHSTSGMAIATYVEGVRAGAGAIDCAISSMAGFSSQPPVETMRAIFSETNYSAELDLEALEKVAAYFSELAPKRQQAANSNLPYIDPAILIHQIPGGMISNFRSQLSMQKALDKLPQVLEEVARVREDLGYPPLVTPTSQIIGTQAVMNVLAGERYKIVPNEVKDYVRGKYGRPPAPIKEEIIRKILGDEKPIVHRPADDIPPMLPKATEGIDPKLIEQEEDIISYVLLPEPAMQYFRWRALPPEERPEPPVDIEFKKMKEEKEKKEEEKVEEKSLEEKRSSTEEKKIPSFIPEVAVEMLEKIEGITIEEIVLRKGDSLISVRPEGTTRGLASVTNISPSVSTLRTVSEKSEKKESVPPITEKKEEQQKPKEESKKESKYSKTIDAPFVGNFYLSPAPGKPPFVKEGDIVEAGAKVCIVEAMKLFNEITAPKRCKILKILVSNGQHVEKDQPLLEIEEL